MRSQSINRIILSVLLLLTTSLAYGQSGHGNVTGKIVDKNTRAPLPGVNVQILGTVLGASTDLDGQFEIRRVPAGRYRLRVTMIGYAKVTLENVQVTSGTTELPNTVELVEAPVEIDPVVVSVSKWKQDAEDTPATVEVLTAKDILQRNPVQIQDALETVTGVQILQENVNIRGSDGFTFGIGSRVLVMMDGISLMTSDFGSVNWFMVSPSDIERAEVVRGAGSAVYGSSAMGGVVNFITRDPSPKARTYVRTMAGFFDDFSQDGWGWSDGTHDFNRIDFTHSKQIGNLGYRVSGGRSYSAGYTEQGEYERYNVSGKFNYHFNDNSSLTFFGNYMHDDSDVFVIWESQRRAAFVAPGERDKHQSRNGLTLFSKYSRPISSKAAVEFRAYLNRFLLGIQFTDVNFAPALGLGGAIQGNYIPFENLSFIWGSDFKFDRAKSDIYGERKAYLVAPYLQADWKFHPRFNLTLGARYDRYEVLAASDTSLSFSESRVYDHVSPKIGLNYHPFDGTTLRGSISNGFKFPVIFQLFFDNQEITNITFVANEQLKSETSWSYEVGLRQNITNSWFFEVNGFLTDVENLIEPGVTGGGTTATFLNTEKVKIPGIEFSSNGRWWQNRLGLRVNLTYLDPHNDKTGDLLTHRQKVIGFVGSSLRLGNFELQADYKYSGKQERYLIPGIPIQFVPQKVMDSRLFFYWNQLTFVTGVNNIFNYAYTLRDNYLEENRSFYVGVTAEF